MIPLWATCVKQKLEFIAIYIVIRWAVSPDDSGNSLKSDHTPSAVFSGSAFLWAEGMLETYRGIEIEW